MAFLYSKLPASSIRLVKLVLNAIPDATPPSTPQPVHLQLYENFRVPSKNRERSPYCPHYTALSYACGSPDDSTHRVIVNGSDFEICDSLFRCLTRLRAQGHGGFLWIDAICIDQSNNLERGDQARMVGDIISNADEVITWVGEEDDSSRTFFTEIANLGPEDLDLRALKRGRQQLEGLGRKLVSLDHRDTLMEASDWHPGKVSLQKLWFDALRDSGWLMVINSMDSFVGNVVQMRSFLNRPYFSRLWILPENYHAKRRTLMCGRSRLDWALIDVVVDVLEHWSPASAEVAPYDEVFLWQQRRVFLDSDLVVFRNPSHDRTGLFRTTRRNPKFGEELLTNFQRFQTADPRDMLFGLMSMPVMQHLPFRPDYSQTTRDLLLTGVSWMISHRSMSPFVFARRLSHLLRIDYERRPYLSIPSLNSGAMAVILDGGECKRLRPLVARGKLITAITEEQVEHFRATMRDIPDKVQVPKQGVALAAQPRSKVALVQKVQDMIWQEFFERPAARSSSLLSINTDQENDLTSIPREEPFGHFICSVEGERRSSAPRSSTLGEMYFIAKATDDTTYRILWRIPKPSWILDTSIVSNDLEFAFDPATALKIVADHDYLYDIDGNAFLYG